jgi:glucokinase
MGAGQGHEHLVYVTISTGIGGALILNGKLYRGMHGMAGEVGHMFISDMTGYPCSCGVTGCVESIASGKHMARYATDRIKEGMDSRILDHAGTMTNIDMVAVGRALAGGDSLAIEIVNRGAEYLGRMFHSLNMIFDINVFVIGGGVTQLGKKFMDRIVASYRHYSLMDQKYPARFLPAALGNDAGLIGAALLVPND